MSARNLSISLLVLALVLLIASPASAQTAEPSDRFTPFDCPTIPSDGYTIRCGYVTVPADHTNPDSGETFQIAVAIVHRDATTNPAPDPLVYVNGGPGSKSIDLMPYFIGRFGAYLLDRDMVFFDHRGIGWSKPALECPELDQVFGSEGTPETNALLLDAANTCHDRLTREGIDLDLFGTAQVAGDLSIMREALGYDHWNLIGISYGTRGILTTLRDHPEGIRSAVLDAVIPPEANLTIQSAAAAESALRRVSDRCAEDPVCGSAYPDTFGTLLRVVDRLDRDPYTLTVTLTDGSQKDFQITGAGFSGSITGLISSAQTIASIPALVYNADRRDFEALKPRYKTIGDAQQNPGANPSTQGEAFSAYCVEEHPFISLEEIATQNEAHPVVGNRSQSLGLDDFCTVWEVSPLGAIENEPVTSDVPVLLMHGEVDALASPGLAENAAKSLSRGTLIIFPNTGHGVPTGCPVGIARRFLNDPTAAVDTSCTAEMAKPPAWVITADYTRPVAQPLAVAALIIAVALSGVGLWSAAGLIRRKGISWKLTLQRIGWWPYPAVIIATIATYGFGQFIEWKPTFGEAVALGSTLVVSIQVALALAPSDEPALEMVLAMPQPFWLLKLGQLAAVLIPQAVLAVLIIGVSCLFTGDPLGIVLLNWLGPFLMLSGLTLFVTARSHQSAVGMLIASLGSFGLAIGSASLLPAQPFGTPWPPPFQALQMVVWMVNPFLAYSDLTPADFFASKAIVCGVGVVLMALGLRALSNDERVLMASQEK